MGMAQSDASGNVNVSRFNGRLAGAGGFINISQNAHKLVFAGTFTAGGLLIHIEDGRLHILREGRYHPSYIEAVEQVTFSGEYAGEKGQQVLYVTERCVFARTHDGVELVEVAPGIDIDRDILAQMGFRPIVDRPRLMDGRLFRPEAMGLHLALHELCVPARVSPCRRPGATRAKTGAVRSGTEICCRRRLKPRESAATTEFRGPP